MHETVILAVRANDDEEFAARVGRAATLGATHVAITVDIPRSLWQFDPPGDPYPAWFSHQPGLMKVFPPRPLEQHVDADYAETVASLLERRCAILRAHGLKAFYWTTEPQVLPETFFVEHPELRGPRVDHPHRSRTARFAPCTDHEQVRALYRESMQRLLERCPEVEILSFLTTDSGSGFCWARSLYPGQNGNPACHSVRMRDRVVGFLTTLQSAAEEVGHPIEIDVREIAPRSWMKPTFDDPAEIAARLPPGLAVNHLEGPDAHAFISGEFMGLHWHELYPVIGIPRPLQLVNRLAAADNGAAVRRLVSFPDGPNTDLYFRVWEAYRNATPSTELDRLALLRSVAADRVGDDLADDLLALWTRIEEATTLMATLDFGPVFRMGGLLARWFTRPLVPYPAELTDAETAHFRPFLFQAKTEAEATNFIDIQAMRMFEGWGARLLTEAAMSRVRERIAEASSLAERVDDGPLVARLRVMDSFCRTVVNVVAYQAQLDRVRSRLDASDSDEGAEAVPVLGHQGDWARQDLLTIARDEVANAVELKALVTGFPDELVDAAARPEEEMSLQLGPDFAGQLHRKIDVMSSHWTDYDRLLTAPNV